MSEELGSYLLVFNLKFFMHAPGTDFSAWLLTLFVRYLRFSIGRNNPGREGRH